MHIYPAAVTGACAWIGSLAAIQTTGMLACGPLIVSAVTLALCLL